MNVAALSIEMVQNNVKNDASVAVMRNIKNIMNEQGEQLVDMLAEATSAAPHPTLGQTIDTRQ